MAELWSELSCLIVPLVLLGFLLFLLTMFQFMLGTTVLRWFIRFVKDAWD